MLVVLRPFAGFVGVFMVLGEKVIRRCTRRLEEKGEAFGGYSFFCFPGVCESTGKLRVFYASRTLGVRLFLSAS